MVGNIEGGLANVIIIYGVAQQVRGVVDLAPGSTMEGSRHIIRGGVMTLPTWLKTGTIPAKPRHVARISPSITDNHTFNHSDIFLKNQFINHFKCYAMTVAHDLLEALIRLISRDIGSANKWIRLYKYWSQSKNTTEIINIFYLIMMYKDYNTCLNKMIMV